MPQFQMPDEQTFKVLKAALAAGVNVWNAADYYGTPEANSLHLLNRYFSAYPEDADKVVLSVKSGLVDRRTMRMDCSAAGLRQSIDKALTILDGKKIINIFGIARIDPDVPVEESVRALDELKNEGKFDGIQLSEVRASTIRRAASVAKIDMVEAEASLWSPMVFDNGVAETCGQLGIVLVAHTPLGFGALTGKIKSLDDLPKDSPLRFLPRYQPDVFPQNLRLVEEVEKLAEIKGCATTQLALSWLKAHTRRPGMPVIVPIAGARSEERVRQNAVDVEITDDDFRAIDKILKSFPVEGYRTMPSMAERNEY